MVQPTTAHFAAELEGESHVLENVARCLQGKYARLRRIEKRWILESSAFERCKTGQEVFPVADMLVSHIHAILSIYLELHAPFSVASILWRNAEGRLKRSLRSHIRLNVYSAKGVRELASLRGGGESFGTILAHRAVAHADFLEALALVGESPLRWSQIYDVIEFLGGPERIAAEGWATKKDAVRIRRTANYYRHLGRQKKDPLPKNPPTLPHARTFVFDLLKQWIATLL